MNALIKSVGFSVIIILCFASVTYVLPQVKGEAPEEETMPVGEMTMGEFISLGEKLYRGKGTCTLCHNNLGRAPDLLTFDVAQAALERIADSRYQGKASDAETYLRESLVEPSVFVVAGFGKKGSNDSESPMPVVDQPPLQLSDVEMNAIIAFLLDKDGNEVTVALPEKSEEADTAEEAGESAPKLAETPQQAIAKFGCSACHTVLDTSSVVGPNLTDVGKRLQPHQIRNSIVDPGAEIAEGFPPIMPKFPNMALAELEILTTFLAQQTGDEQ